MDYLNSHDEIVNCVAQELCGIASENSMKEVFYRLQKAGKIGPVPGKRGSASAWRKATAPPASVPSPTSPLARFAARFNGR
jgi:ATP-dependent DNA helicase RecG